MRVPSLLICTLMALCVVGMASNGFAAIEEVVISAETIKDFGETSPENTAFARDADASNGLAFQFIGGAVSSTDRRTIIMVGGRVLVRGRHLFRLCKRQK